MADVKNVSEQFKPSNRSTVVDQIIESSLESSDYSNQIFQRVVAKEVEFKKADFKYTVFDNCYFRKCKFVGCDFTGCKFTGSNFRGAEFSGCKFDYATFEKTIIEDSLLDNSCPSYENLKLNFARSLRTNFQSLGDAEGSNKAIKLELSATEIHLKKSWYSEDSYYRSTYSGFGIRSKMFLKWLNFKTMDLIWGNGESIWKLIRATFVIVIVMAIVHIFVIKSHSLVDMLKAIGYTPQVFLGVAKPNNYHEGYIAFLIFLRLILFGFFMAILVKRFSKR